MGKELQERPERTTKTEKYQGHRSGRAVCVETFFFPFFFWSLGWWLKVDGTSFHDLSFFLKL